MRDHEVQLKKKVLSNSDKSKGTAIGEKARKRMNSYDDAKRQELLDRGMAMIYGATQKNGHRG